MPRRALIIVDMQEDFMPWGALPVKGADEIIPTVNRYVTLFVEAGELVVATRDWHPEDHVSFKEQGGPWPKHCVRGTKGAEFVRGLELPENTLVISKATDRDRDAYSGFQGTGLGEKLKELGVKETYVCGVATEYCVKSTALDSLKLGFKTYLLVDAIKGVSEEGSAEALKELERSGVVLVRFEDVERYLKG